MSWEKSRPNTRIDFSMNNSQEPEYCDIKNMKEFLSKKIQNKDMILRSLKFDYETLRNQVEREKNINEYLHSDIEKTLTSFYEDRNTYKIKVMDYFSKKMDKKDLQKFFEISHQMYCK